MDYILATVVLAVCLVSGCGATAPNTDKPTGLYIASSHKVSDEYNVDVASKLPSSGGKQLSGVSCKNKVWDPQINAGKDCLGLVCSCEAKVKI